MITKKIEVNQLNLSESTRYSYYSIKNESQMTIPIGPIAGVIYLLSSLKPVKIFNQILSNNEFLEFSIDTEFFLTLNLKVHILIVFSPYTLPDNYIKIHSLDKCKIVTKPWGNEKWIICDNNLFSFKRIFIRKGFRTSLQYHVKKEETNFLHSGRANLYYTNCLGEEYHSHRKHLFNKKFYCGHYVHIPPNTTHRIEAISDVTLFEASTPELDDVIRIEDDTGRADGRIICEHDSLA